MKIILDLTQIYNFFSSNTFVAVSIILTGLYIVNYYKNHYASKRRWAAKLAISEIRAAEERIENIAHSLSIYYHGDYTPVSPNNSWKKLKKYFADVLDQGELQLIDAFFISCKSIDDFIKEENKVFWKNASAKASVIQKKMADAVIRSYHNGRIDRNVLSNYKKIVLDTITHDDYIFMPKQAVKLLDSHIIRARRITETSAWTKLKKIAEIQ